MSSKPKPTRLSRTSAQPTADELLHFFNQSPDLLCIAGFDGIFKRLNPAWSPLLGWTNAELMARPFLFFVHPDDRAAMPLSGWAEAGLNVPSGIKGQICTVEVRLVRKVVGQITVKDRAALDALLRQWLSL